MYRDDGKKIVGFENLTYSKRLKELDLFSVEGRLLSADIIKYWKISHSKCGICPEVIFVLARSSITRGHRFTIVHEIFSMDCSGSCIYLEFLTTRCCRS